MSIHACQKKKMMEISFDVETESVATEYVPDSDSSDDDVLVTTGLCKMKGCNAASWVKELCQKHYNHNYRKKYRKLITEGVVVNERYCRSEGCANRPYAKGFCKKHRIITDRIKAMIRRPCIYPECENLTHRAQTCKFHTEREKYQVKNKEKQMYCKHVGCDRKLSASGICWFHGGRIRRGNEADDKIISEFCAKYRFNKQAFEELHKKTLDVNILNKLVMNTTVSSSLKPESLLY
jgi:hypothetical protein